MIPLIDRTPKEDKFQFFESDLYLLRKVFMPNAGQVFVLDPHHRVRENWHTDLIFVRDRATVQQIGRRPVSYGVINISKLPIRRHPFPLKRLNSAISFYPYTTDEELLPYRHTHYIIENPYQTIRWVIPDGMRNAHFNQLYVEDLAYPRLWRWMVALAAATNRWRWITEARFISYQLTSSPLSFLSSDLAIEFSHYALFAGRMNITGRVLIPLWNRKEIVAFVKLAIRKGAKNGIWSEVKAIHRIAENKPPGLVVPRVQWHEEYSILTPIFPMNAHPVEELTLPIVRCWEAIQVRWAKNYSLEEWIEANRWKERIATIARRANNGDVPSGVSPQNVMMLMSLIQRALHLIRSQHFMFALAHGDFSPRNIYWDGHTIYAVDWEHVRWNAPRFADFFNFLIEPFETRGTTDPDQLIEGLTQWWHQLPVQWQDHETQKMDHHILLCLSDRVLNYLEPIMEKRVVSHQVNLRFYLWKQIFEHFLDANS